MRRFAFVFVAALVFSTPATASVTRVVVASRAVVANGQAFGPAGPYEKIAGTVYFEIDPADPRNRAITDIALAPRNGRGHVEFSADLFILTPRDSARSSGSLLFEISNRGGKGLLTTFNRATVGSADPSLPEHFGDGLLMRHGFTLVWVGWEFDVGPLPQLSVKAPIATTNGSPIEGRITTSFVLDAGATVASLKDVAGYPPREPRYAAHLLPRIMYTNSSVEYWGTGRAAALTHTSPDGSTDLVLPANVRIYHFAGTQHGPAAFPPSAGPGGRGTGQQLGNPTPFTIGLRALVLALDRWVRDETPPPASRHSRLIDSSLTPIDRLRWPALPGVASPSAIPQPRRAEGDGPTGQPWPFLVPQVDEDGNELGGIRLPDVAVPFGTSTGWNFRSPATGNPQMIVPLLGSFVPFARTAADRERTNDPRRAVAERYASKHDYLGRVAEVTLDLVKQGYLLREDAPLLLERATANWDWMTQPPTKQTAQQ